MPERADGSVRWRVRRALKAAVAGTLICAGADRAVRAVRRWQAGGVRVLIVSYHRVTHDYEASAQEGLASLLVSARTLRLQLEQLARTRDLVSLSDARRLLAAPPVRGPVRDVAAVTFDDGYADLRGVALPILEALRVPAAAFVVTGYVGTSQRLPHDRIYAALSELAARGIRPTQAALPPSLQPALDECRDMGPAAALDRLIARLPPPALEALCKALSARVGQSEQDLPAATRLLSWEDLSDLKGAGVEVGGHTAHHAVLPLLTPTEARREIESCRDAIRDRLGQAPRHFAYPNGYHTAAVRRLVAAAGFEGAVTTEDRENARGHDPYRLKRKMLWENTTLGPTDYSGALAVCNLEGVFSALGLARAVPGEYSGLPAETPERSRAWREPVSRPPSDPERTMAGP
ncbi:MAG TPA: polysaccharide deacetylase family protein [Anaeromyxobacter sp.]|nr:polysaccharide deacetylase family protein [Anaeromyxobacter sp.]